VIGTLAVDGCADNFSRAESNLTIGLHHVALKS